MGQLLGLNKGSGMDGRPVATRGELFEVTSREIMWRGLVGVSKEKRGMRSCSGRRGRSL